MSPTGSTTARPEPRRLVATAATAVWLAAVAAGFAAWERYDATPGSPAPTVAANGRPPRTLTLYAHPHCPCTRASLGELAELARALPAGYAVEVVFVRPAGVEPGWERTASWDAAAAVPGAGVRCDPGGAEAARAGATTSGHAVLTDAAGRVVFSGGLTRGRGRVGEAAGGRAVLAAAAGETCAADAPVFGCPLVGESQ